MEGLELAISCLPKWAAIVKHGDRNGRPLTEHPEHPGLHTALNLTKLRGTQDKHLFCKHVHFFEDGIASMTSNREPAE